MGTIKGDVDVLSIAILLQMLSANNCKGYLTISEDDQHKIIEFGKKPSASLTVPETRTPWAKSFSGPGSSPVIS